MEKLHHKEAVTSAPFRSQADVHEEAPTDLRVERLPLPTARLLLQEHAEKAAFEYLTHGDESVVADHFKAFLRESREDASIHKQDFLRELSQTLTRESVAQLNLLAFERGQLVAMRESSPQSLLLHEQALRKSIEISPDFEKHLVAQETKGALHALEIEKLVLECSSAMHRRGSSLAPVAERIAKLSNRERDRFSTMYRERSGNYVDVEARSKLKPQLAGMLTQALRGDLVGVFSAELHAALFGLPWKRYHKTLAIVERARSEDGLLPKIGERLVKQLSVDGKTVNLHSVVQNKIRNPLARDHIITLARGDVATAERLGLRYLCTQISFFSRIRVGKQIVERLQHLQPQARNQLLREYERCYAEPITETLRRNKVPESLCLVVEGIRTQDTHLTNAAKVRAGFLGHIQSWVGEVAFGKTEGELTQLRQDYEARFKSNFDRDFRRATQTPRLLRFMFADEYEAIKNLYHKGTLSDVELIAHCMFGIGTDEQGLRKMLTGRTHDELARLRIDYARRFPGRSMIHDIFSEVSGDDRFDISQLLLGVPETSLQLAAIVSDRLAYEQSGSLSRPLHRFLTKMCMKIPRKLFLLKRMFQEFNAEGRLLRKDGLKAMHGFHEMERLSEKDPSFQRQKTSCAIEARRFIATADKFREVENKIVDFLSGMAGSSIGALTIGACLLSSYGIAFTLIAGFGASLMARGMVKWKLKGIAYGHEEMMLDTLRSAVVGTGAFSSQMPARFFIKRITSTLTSNGLGQLVEATRYMKKHSLTSIILGYSSRDALSRDYVERSAESPVRLKYFERLSSLLDSVHSELPRSTEA